MWGGVEAEVEVFNLFSGSVRQEGLSRIEQARQRQTLVPDLRISVPPLICEADRHHNDIPAGQVGPCEKKLVDLGELHGLVAGGFGEVSEASHLWPPTE